LDIELKAGCEVVADDSPARRNRSIRLAVLTSLLSKGGTILLQLISIPVAIRVLGREEFGLYATVNLSLTLVGLLQVGVGPALAHGLAKSRAEGDEERQGVLVTTAMLLMLGVIVVLGVLLGLLMWSVPLTDLYGDTYAGKESALGPALWIGLGVSLCLFLLNLTERIREGRLQVACNNVWGAAGNVLAAVAVGIGVWWLPEVWFLVVAVHGSLLLAKVGNTIVLWLEDVRMRPWTGRFCGKTAKHLFTDGLSFSTCCLVTGVVEYNFAGWMVGRLSGGPSELALYSVFISLSIMQMGVVFMVSAPTWPAVAEAMARGDVGWARRAAKRMYWYGMGFALASAVGLVVLGPLLFRWWLGPEFAATGRLVFACYGAYFAANVWRHLNHTLMIGTGQVGRLARVQLLESALVALAAWVGLSQGGIGGLLLGMAVVMILVTGWVLPLRVRECLRG
jgi:O-antigen/teichoic acid export membrane protein